MSLITGLEDKSNTNSKESRSDEKLLNAQWAGGMNFVSSVANR